MRQRGFTLLELLAALAVLAVLGALGFRGLNSVLETESRLQASSAAGTMWRCFSPNSART